MAVALGAQAGTFRAARTEPVHRWFPWIEGFSTELPQLAIDRHAPESIYDPFLGCGTTAVVATRVGIDAAGAEVNPFLRLVVRVKTSVARHLRMQDPDRLREELSSIAQAASGARGAPLSPLFLDADYFEPVALADITRVKAAIDAWDGTPGVRDLCRLALGSVLVDCSNMIRRSDLRRRRPNETNGQGKQVLPRFEAALLTMAEDIAGLPDDMGSLRHVLLDAKTPPASTDPLYDACVTSPPYLNGTNYVRNTKLELWALDQIARAEDIRALRDDGITAGINNVRLARAATAPSIPRLTRVLRQLTERSYDPRIPRLVEGYFEDMTAAMSSTARRLRRGAPVYLDIGDSYFADVHVPTDVILIECAELAGLDLRDSIDLRKRRSYGGQPLRQRLLIFRTRARRRGSARPPASPADRLAKLVSERPFAQRPYSARNWGHPWHSLCSYQAKLKPGIAHFLVSEFSSPGDVVLDPFAGAGTIPHEACLQGRIGWANDINPLAAQLMAAKVSRPDPKLVNARMEELLTWVNARASRMRPGSIAGWGHNRSLGEYYDDKTFREILAARRWFLTAAPRDPATSMLWAAVAHLLHGNRPYALSRRSHPITPFAPTGEFEHRPIRPRLEDKVARTLAAPFPEAWIDGMVTTDDATNLSSAPTPADIVITSPPFFGSARFHINNWIRFWFCGWEPGDFERERDRYVEYRQMRDFVVYAPILESIHQRLRSGGLAVWHLGKSSRFDMASELEQLADPWFSVAGRFSEDVTACQRHGVSAQGVTTQHQFLLLSAR